MAAVPAPDEATARRTIIHQSNVEGSHVVRIIAEDKLIIKRLPRAQRTYAVDPEVRRSMTQ